MDEEAINRREPKRLVKAIANEDKNLRSFGIPRKVQKIISKQQKNKKTRE